MKSTLLVSVLVLTSSSLLESAEPKQTPPELRLKAEKGNSSAILQLGDLRDRESIAMLREKATGANKRPTGAAGAAQMALAKMGEKKEFQEILAELKSTHPRIQDDAVKKLTYVGGKGAIREIAALLEISQWRTSEVAESTSSPKAMDKEFFSPLSMLAVEALGKLVSQGPKRRQKTISEDDVVAWRRWWSEHQKEFR